MSVVGLCAFAILAVFLAACVKQMEPKWGALTVTAAGIVFWIYAVKELLPLAAALMGMTKGTMAESAFSALFRALGLALVISFAAGVCRDLGETGTAEKLEFCGKIALVSLALPLLKSTLAAITGLLS